MSHVPMTMWSPRQVTHLPSCEAAVWIKVGLGLVTWLDFVIPMFIRHKGGRVDTLIMLTPRRAEGREFEPRPGHYS